MKRFWIFDFRFSIGSGRKRIFCLVVCVVLIALCSSVEAQQPKKIARIGYLSNTTPTRESTRSEEIRLALRDLGYIEGQNIVFEYRYGQGKLDSYPRIAAELVSLKVDVILVAGGSAIIRSAKSATTTIPIVMIGSTADPVETGLIESLAHPGGNVTGLTSLSRELGGKRLELLKETIPKIARVAVLYDPASPTIVVEVNEDLPLAARTLGLMVRSWAVRNADGFERVFAALREEHPDGLYVPSGALMSANGKRIADFALKSRFPSVYGRREAVDVGGLMSYGAKAADTHRRVAYYLDKIVKGAKPGDLPVEQPTKFELLINLKTAKQIGLTIPPNVLARADRVVR